MVTVRSAASTLNQIGRASCRERGVDLGGRRIIKKKKRAHALVETTVNSRRAGLERKRSALAARASGCGGGSVACGDSRISCACVCFFFKQKTAYEIIV